VRCLSSCDGAAGGGVDGDCAGSCSLAGEASSVGADASFLVDGSGSITTGSSSSDSEEASLCSGCGDGCATGSFDFPTPINVNWPFKQIGVLIEKDCWKA